MRLQTNTSPQLRPSETEIADTGTVRFGSGCITAAFPLLRDPKPEIAERGTVGLGSGCIGAEFPTR
ncbi:MAG: hypothetical protein JO001_16695 [Alphaproteobacteria bacterium]|nr:hypothetical protein [Alphaproteobacteria bacterium]